MLIGYTTGTFDMFHVGHLNILRSARAMCDKLIVGVSTDEILVYKGRKCIIPLSQRIEVVRGIKYADVVIPQYDINKVTAYHKLKYDILFVGDDWHATPQWDNYEKDLAYYGVKIVYFPRTVHVSTTQIIEKIKNE